MSRRGLLPRLLLATSVGLACLLVASWWLGPRWLGKLAADRIEAEASTRGVPIRVDGVRVGVRTTTIEALCVDALPPANGELACLEGVSVSLDVLATLRGAREVGPVRVTTVRVDASSERGSLTELQASVEAMVAAVRGDRGRDDAEGSGDEAPAPRMARRGRPEIPSIAIDEATVATAGQGLPLERATMRAFALDPAAEEWTLRAVLVPGAIDAATLQALGVQVPAEWTVDARWPVVGRPTAEVRFDTPLQAAIPVAPGWTASLTGLRVGGMDQAAVLGVSLAHSSEDAPAFRADQVEVELREFTTRLEDLYIARLALVGADIQLALDGDGRLVLPDAPQAEAPVEAPVEAQAEPEELAELTEPAAAPAPGLWTDRRWWERLPQAIELNDAALTLQVPDAEGGVTAFTVSDLNVSYAIRALNTQLDAQIRASLAVGEQSAGSFEISAAWDWAHKNLELDLGLDAVELGMLRPMLTHVAPWLSLEGQLDLNARFRQRTDRTIPDFSGSMTLEGLELQLHRMRDGARVPVFASELSIPTVQYTWSARQDPADEERRLVWQDGALRVGRATAAFTPTLYRLELHRRRIVEAIDIAWEIPSQPAQTWFDTVPDALLGPLAGASMEGAFSWQFGFPIRWVADEDGVRRLDLDEPFVDALDTSTLRLVSLPEPVDVRRLNEAFSFVFRGPDDTILRSMSVPPPRTSAPEGVAAPTDPAPSPTTGGWVRLEQIAYPLIAAQLYREDGRFFMNSGVNWYQIRLVLEQAAQDGWPERGASTISMQLIKNVFLTHERSIERKLQELFLTYWMTRLVPKERVLEVYLNVIEWGPGINGILEAAEYYFGLHPSELNLPQSVWLASITPAPRRRAAQREMGSPPDWQMRWVHDLMRGMHDRGWITETELAKGLQTPIVFAGDGTTPRTSALPAASPAAVLNEPELDQEGWLDAAVQHPSAAVSAETGDAPVGLRERPDPAARTRALIERQRPLRP